MHRIIIGLPELTKVFSNMWKFKINVRIINNINSDAVNLHCGVSCRTKHLDPIVRGLLSIFVSKLIHETEKCEQSYKSNTRVHDI